jgi:deazaflavin-dependent oxidoreductase (nitroreductase family)
VTSEPGARRANGSRAQFNIPVIEKYRANRDQRRMDPAGYGMILLTTTGARTGEPRTSPLGCVLDGERLVVVGAAAGAPANPAWYHNLRANPEVTVEVGPETFQASATVAEGEERERLYARHVQRYPVYREYEQKTDRRFPVVVLERIPG